MKEEEIKLAFVKVLSKLEYPETEYTDELWREMVEVVKIYKDRKVTFLLTDGAEVSTTI